MIFRPFTRSVARILVVRHQSRSVERKTRFKKTLQSFFLLLLATLNLLRFAKHLTRIINQVLLWVPKIEWVRREIARDYGCTQKQRAPREQHYLSHVLLIDNANLGGVRFRRDGFFQFQKRGQLFICPHSEALSVIAMRVCNPDRSSARIEG